MNDQANRPETERPATPLRAALNQYRGGFAAIAVFSSLVNILMLVSPVYMLQMYDRVLTSGSGDTLLMLTLIAVFLLVCFGFLEWVRQRLMQRIALALGLNMANDVLASRVRSNLASQTQSSTQTGAGTWTPFASSWAVPRFSPSSTFPGRPYSPP